MAATEWPIPAQRFLYRWWKSHRPVNTRARDFAGTEACPAERFLVSSSCPPIERKSPRELTFFKHPRVHSREEEAKIFYRNRANWPANLSTCRIPLHRGPRANPTDFVVIVVVFFFLFFLSMKSREILYSATRHAAATRIELLPYEIQKVHANNAYSLFVHYVHARMCVFNIK